MNVIHENDCKQNINHQGAKTLVNRLRDLLLPLLSLCLLTRHGLSCCMWKPSILLVGYYKDRSCFMKMYTTMSAQVNGALKNKETPLHGTSMWTTNWESSSLATWWWWVYLFYVWILLHFMYSFKRSVLSNLVILFKRCSNPFQPIGKRSSSKVEHKLILSPHAFHFF